VNVSSRSLKNELQWRQSEGEGRGREREGREGKENGILLLSDFLAIRPCVLRSLLYRAEWCGRE